MYAFISCSKTATLMTKSLQRLGNSEVHQQVVVEAFSSASFQSQSKTATGKWQHWECGVLHGLWGDNNYLLGKNSENISIFLQPNNQIGITTPFSSRRLQSGMNLQICFVNDSGSDKDSDADDSKTETSLDTPLSPMVGLEPGNGKRTDPIKI